MTIKCCYSETSKIILIKLFSSQHPIEWVNHYYSVYCSSPEAKEKFKTILHQIKDKSINLQLKFPENYLKDKEHPIWKYFNICDQDSNNATCKVCSAEMYIYAKGGGMRNHILLKHTLEWLEVYIEWYIDKTEKLKDVKSYKGDDPISDYSCLTCKNQGPRGKKF